MEKEECKNPEEAFNRLRDSFVAFNKAMDDYKACYERYCKKYPLKRKEIIKKLKRPIMRKIKFRGKTISEPKIWLQGDLSQNTDGKFWILKSRVIPETVGQFTGLLDKNGKEIYEGDILNFHWNEPCNGVVIFEDSAFCIENVTNRVTGIGQENGFLLANYIQSKEVIGNIHDNPELLNN